MITTDRAGRARVWFAGYTEAAAWRIIEPFRRIDLGWIGQIPQIDIALIVALLVSAVAALMTSHRGGRFRGLLGWVGIWVVFAIVLVALSRTTPAWVSLGLLALLMFGTLRSYFYLVPLRPKDRGAIGAAYLAIPIALYPGFTGSIDTFLATVPILLFLLFPVLLALGRAQNGFLDSVGRVLLGVLTFVFCPAHLALLVHREQAGLLELYGVLVLAAELPQRLAAGRSAQGPGWLRPTLGLVASVVVTAAAGYWLGPICGLEAEDGARAGLFVALAVAMGRLVAEAVSRDVGQGATTHRLRTVLLDRAFPAVYAAPVFFHYLNHFA